MKNRIKKIVYSFLKPFYNEFERRQIVMLKEEMQESSKLFFEKCSCSEAKIREISIALSNAKNWQEFSNDHFMQALFNEKEKFEIFYNMLEDSESKKTFNWLVGYRFLAAITGEVDLWNTFEPSILYKILPGPTSVEDFKCELQKTKNIISKLPSDESELYCLWHTFISEQYSLNDICEVEDNDIVFDIGGYIGDTAIYFSQKMHGTGHIYIFEASDWMVSKIKENTKKCNINNYTVIQKAAWNKNCNLYLADNTTYETPIEDAFSMEAITLDCFVKENNINKVDFIKMDIEGSETNALLGATSILNTNRPKLAISIYHGGEKQLGYKDFYNLPLLLRDICPNYKFYLSHKNASLFETILFCVPNEKYKQ